MAQIKVKKINKALNVKKLDKMLHHFESYSFIKLVKNTTIQFSFLTENIKEFIRREWFLANFVLPDQPTFLFNSLQTTENLNTAFKGVKNLTSSLPFSLIEVGNNECEVLETESLSRPADVVKILHNQFKMRSGTVLRSLTFQAPVNAEEYFYRVQKNRKIWWRKFANCPGRFLISTPITDETDNSLTSEIQAEFPWGLETVETIKYSPEFCEENGQGLFEAKVSKRKKCIPQVITCETILENMAFTYLCDSYENLDGNSDRDYLRLDKSLAPYKVSVAGTGESSEVIKDLEELSLLMAKQIKKLGLPVLHLPDACTTSIEKQIQRNDALGVPYTLILNDKSLKDGIIFLRSRDTTLEEQSHVSVIAEYLKKIF